ncbi:MAG: GntR family transcriptional regulator [Roseitalea porphyridii]
MEPVGSKNSLSEEVHARLVDAMCSGALPPGTLLRQEALAAELNVSRQPIIQALGFLRRDGLIEPAGRRGYKVTAVDVDLVRHVYDLRAAFDGLAARLAANAPAADRKDALAAEIAEGDAALESGDTSALVAADISFHQALYALSGNPLLPDASAAVWRQVRRVMHAVLEKHDARKAVWTEHRAIADAVRTGDAAAAERAAASHARDAADRLVAWMATPQNGTTKIDNKETLPSDYRFGSVGG